MKKENKSTAKLTAQERKAEMSEEEKEIMEIINNVKGTPAQKAFLKALTEATFGIKLEDDTEDNYSIWWSTPFEKTNRFDEICKEKGIEYKEKEGKIYFDHIKVKSLIWNDIRPYLPDEYYVNILDYEYGELVDIRVAKNTGCISARALIEEADHKEYNCYIKWDGGVEYVESHPNKKIGYDVTTTVNKIWDGFTRKDVVMTNLQIGTCGIINGYEITEDGIFLFPDLKNGQTAERLKGTLLKEFDSWNLYKTTVENPGEILADTFYEYTGGKNKEQYISACESFKDYIYRNYDCVQI